MGKIRVILALLSGIAIAEGMDSGADNVGFYFQRGIDFYRWQSSVSESLTLGSSDFYGNSELSLMLRRPPGYSDQWKTSGKFQGEWAKPFIKGMAYKGIAQGEFFSDQTAKQYPPSYLQSSYPSTVLLQPSSSLNLTTGLNARILRESFRLGVDTVRFIGLNYSPLAGIYGEQIDNNTAVGPTGDLNISGENLDLGGYTSDFIASAQAQFLGERRHREVSAQFSALKQYSSASVNSFASEYRNYVREFPLANGVIDRRFEEEFRLRENLLYQVHPELGMKFDIGFSRRHIEPTIFNQTNRLSEIGLEAEAGVIGAIDRHSFTLSFGSQGQNQSFPLRQVQMRQYNLKGSLDLGFTQDSLKLQIFLSRYKYDIAPEVYSGNTHDEIVHSYKATHLHNYGEGLELETQIRADLRHLVYLKAERSADNNWERFFLFSPSVRYISEAWSQQARFRVSADYIDYDFEGYAPPSKVFRKFSAEDSLFIGLSQQWSLKVQYLFILEDQGQLDWSAFVQELSDRYRTNDASGMFSYKAGALDYGFGWAVYHRRGIHYGGSSSLPPEDTVMSSGPIISLSGKGIWEMQIEFSASFRRITETLKKPYTQTMVDLALIKYFP